MTGRRARVIIAHRDAFVIKLGRMSERGSIAGGSQLCQWRSFRFTRCRISLQSAAKLYYLTARRLLIFALGFRQLHRLIGASWQTGFFIFLIFFYKRSDCSVIVDELKKKSSPLLDNLIIRAAIQ